MTATHNIFIHRINAVVAHAPSIFQDKTRPFIAFLFSVLSEGS